MDGSFTSSPIMDIRGRTLVRSEAFSPGGHRRLWWRDSTRLLGQGASDIRGAPSCSPWLFFRRALDPLFRYLLMTHCDVPYNSQPNRLTHVTNRPNGRKDGKCNCTWVQINAKCIELPINENSQSSTILYMTIF